MLLRSVKDNGKPLNSVYGLKYLWLNFSIIGIHPPAVCYKHEILLWLYYAYSAVIISLAGLCLPATMLAKLLYIDSLQEVIGNLSLSFTIAISMAKQLAILMNRTKLLGSNNYLHELDKRCNAHDEDRLHILNSIRNCHLFYLAYIGFYAFCATGFAYIGWSSHNLVYSAWFPRLFADDEWNYRAAFTYQNLAQTFTVFQNGNNDMYPLCYLSLMIGHLRALSGRIARVGMERNRTVNENTEELLKCIQDHKNILSYFESIKPCISATLAQQFIVTGFVLCLTAVNLIAFDSDFTEKMFKIVYLGVILIQVFPCCWYVNVLMEESSYLTTAMYSCNWMEQNQRFRKMLIIFMQRSQKSNIIMAGGLASVTLQTFLAIVKFSFSMFTILSQMKIS